MTLDERQIAWQRWRNEFFATLSDEGRANGRELSMGMNYRAVHGLVERRSEIEASWGHYHRAIVPADTALKAARRSGDAAAYLAALEHCERLMAAPGSRY